MSKRDQAFMQINAAKPVHAHVRDQAISVGYPGRTQENFRALKCLDIETHRLEKVGETLAAQLVIVYDRNFRVRDH